MSKNVNTFNRKHRLVLLVSRTSCGILPYHLAVMS